MYRLLKKVLILLSFTLYIFPYCTILLYYLKKFNAMVRTSSATKLELICKVRTFNSQVSEEIEKLGVNLYLKLARVLLI